MEAELEDPYILIYDKKISNMKDLLPLLEKVVQTGKPVMIIAEDVDIQSDENDFYGLEAFAVKIVRNNDPEMLIAHEREFDIVNVPKDRPVLMSIDCIIA